MTKRRVVVANVAAFVLAIGLGLLAGDFDYHFKEHRFITWFSVGQLLLTARMCRKTFRVRRVRLWLLLTIGFWFLALDEGAKVHENIDRAIHSVFDMQETALTDRIDDLLVGLYGLIGFGVLYAYREELENFRSARRYGVTAFAAVFFMVCLDLAINRPDLVYRLTHDPATAEAWRDGLGIAEEGLKLTGEMMFLFAGMECLHTARKLQSVEDVNPA